MCDTTLYGMCDTTLYGMCDTTLYMWYVRHHPVGMCAGDLGLTAMGLPVYETPLTDLL